MAEPDSGRPLQLRRRGPPAPSRRRRGAGCDPRPRPLGVVDRRRARGGPGGDGARAASAAGLPVLAGPQHRVRCSRTRACASGRPPPTAGREPVPVRERQPSLPRDRRAQRGFAHAARAGAHRCCARTSAASRSGALPVEGTDYDFRRPRPIGATVLDHAFTDLERGDDGRARVELRRPGPGRRAHALGRRDATRT